MAEQDEPNVESNEPVIADKTTDLEVEDPAGGQSLTYRVQEGQPVPPHLVAAYQDKHGGGSSKAAKGERSKKVDAPEKDK